MILPCNRKKKGKKNTKNCSYEFLILAIIKYIYIHMCSRYECIKKGITTTENI